MFQSPGKIPLTSSAAAGKDGELVSRGEGRKLLVMCVLFIVVFAFVIQLLLPKSKAPTEPKRVGTPLGEAELLEVRKRIEAEPATDKPFEADPQVKERAKDFVLNVFEDDMLFYALHRVHVDETPESLAAAATPIDTGKDYIRLFNSDEACKESRGKVFRIAGRLEYYEQRVLEKWPNEANLAWVWQGLLRSDAGMFWVVITDKDIEPELGIRMGDTLAVDAVFAKGYRYESGERGILGMPLVVGRDFRRLRSRSYESAYPYEVGYIMAALIAMTFIAGVVFWITTAKDQKKGIQQQRELQRRRLQRTLSKQGAEPSPEAETPTPAADGLAPPAGHSDAPPAEAPAESTPEDAAPEAAPADEVPAEAAPAEDAPAEDATAPTEAADAEPPKPQEPEAPAEAADAPPTDALAGAEEPAPSDGDAPAKAPEPASADEAPATPDDAGAGEEPKAS